MKTWLKYSIIINIVIAIIVVVVTSVLLTRKNSNAFVSGNVTTGTISGSFIIPAGTKSYNVILDNVIEGKLYTQYTGQLLITDPNNVSFSALVSTVGNKISNISKKTTSESSNDTTNISSELTTQNGNLQFVLNTPTTGKYTWQMSVVGVSNSV